MYLRRGNLDLHPDGTFRLVFAPNYFACSLSTLFVEVELSIETIWKSNQVLKPFCANPGMAK